MDIEEGLPLWESPSFICMRVHPCGISMAEVGRMRKTLLIEHAGDGVLVVNGQFCGPMEREGQAFPCGENEEVYIQLFPYGERMPLAAKLLLRGGQIAALEPQENCFALLWPDGIIQLELRLQRAEAQHERQTQEGLMNVLLRYLNMKLSGDAQARLLLMGQDERIVPDLSAYHAAVPLRFAPIDADDRFDTRAGLVRRVAENIACVDAVLAATLPVGQGRRVIERMEILRT